MAPLGFYGSYTGASYDTLGAEREVCVVEQSSTISARVFIESQTFPFLRLKNVAERTFQMSLDIFNLTEYKNVLR